MLHHTRLLCISAGAALLLSALGAPNASAPASATQHHAPVAQPFKPLTFERLPKQSATNQPDTSKTYDRLNPCTLVPLPEIRQITNEALLYFSMQNGESFTANVNDAQVWASRHGRRLTCNLASGFNNGRPGLYISSQLNVSVASFWERWHTENHDSIQQRSARKIALSIPAVNGSYLVYERQAGHDNLLWLVVRTKYGTELSVCWPKMSQLTELMRAVVSTIDGSRYGINK